MTIPRSSAWTDKPGDRIRAVNRIAGLTANDLRILIEMAWRDGPGGCYAGAALIGAEAGVSRTQTFASIKRMEGRGILTRHQREGRSTEYQLHYDRWPELPDPTRGRSERLKSGKKSSPLTGDSIQSPNGGLASPLTGDSSVPYQGTPESPNTEHVTGKEPEIKPEGNRNEPVQARGQPFSPIDAIEAYNAVADDLGLTKAVNATPTRIRAIEELLAQSDGSPEPWMTALDEIRRSPMLRGESDLSWRVNLDWLLKRKRTGSYDNFIGVMEGTYRDLGLSKAEMRSRRRRKATDEALAALYRYATEDDQTEQPAPEPEPERPAEPEPEQPAPEPEPEPAPEPLSEHQRLLFLAGRKGLQRTSCYVCGCTDPGRALKDYRCHACKDAGKTIDDATGTQTDDANC